MSTIASVLSEQRTAIINENNYRRKHILEKITELACAKSVDILPSDVLVALQKREQLGSTALNHGVAIPHCRLKDLHYPMAVLLKLNHPVDYEAEDGKPVDLIFALIVPAEENDMYLDILKSIVEKLRKSDYRQGLRQAQDVHALYQAAIKDDEA